MNEKIEHLVNLVSENDDQLAFNKLYGHFLPGLLSFALSILKNKENAEEVVLDVFMKLWENRKTLKTIKKLSNYLYVATKHGSISQLRKKNIIHFNEFSDELAYSLESPEKIFITKENLQVINEVIATLPDKCRLIFRLVKDERLSYEEVANLLKLSKKTVESQLYIAYKRLVSQLKMKLPEHTQNFSAKK